jgi:hypothetical protein
MARVLQQQMAKQQAAEHRLAARVWPDGHTLFVNRYFLFLHKIQ